MKHRSALILLGSVIATQLWCKRSTPQTEPDPPVAEPVLPRSNPGTDVVAATGPRAELNSTNYTLTVALAPVAAPGDSAFTFELRGTTGYHVNEQYPIAIDLEFANATAAKTALRRADALEVSEARARFSLPVHTTGPAATVRGQARFAVCSSENCVPETRHFALVIP